MTRPLSSHEGLKAEYKSVFLNQAEGVADMSFIQDVNGWIERLEKDPIMKILMKNSNLTEIQYETFLINNLAINQVENKISTKNQALFRKTRKISKGAFNRTLTQARKNVIRSIYTIILLGYLGLLSTPSIQQFEEIAEKLKAYSDMYIEVLQDTHQPQEEEIDTLRMIESELEKTISLLANPKNLHRDL